MLPLSKQLLQFSIWFKFCQYPRGYLLVDKKNPPGPRRDRRHSSYFLSGLTARSDDEPDDQQDHEDRDRPVEWLLGLDSAWLVGCHTTIGQTIATTLLCHTHPPDSIHFLRAKYSAAKGLRASFVAKMACS